MLGKTLSTKGGVSHAECTKQMYIQMSACDFVLNSDTRPQGPQVIYNLQFRHLADVLNPERLTMARYVGKI